HFLAYNDYLFGIQNNSYIGKILRSSDSGTTWEELDIPVIINLSSIVSYRGELYIDGFEGLFKSNDNGESWQQVEYTTTVNSSVQQLYVHNNYLLLKDNSASGFYRTENGVDWNYISSTNLSFSSLFKSYGNILFAAAGYN